MLRRREIMGFLLAPLPILTPFLLMFGVILSGAPSDSASLFEAMLEIVLLGYGATLLIGLPIHLVLRWKRQSGLSAYLALSVMSTLLIASILAVLERLFPPTVEDNPFGMVMWSRFGVTVTLTFAIIAALSAWVFWRVAVRQPRL